MSLLRHCCDFRQRYAVLVDNVFFLKGKKSSGQESIDKLTYYVISSPEKLDRIATRLYSHLINFFKSNKNDMVILVFKVMNLLLDNSPSSYINLMMDEYFKMIVKLLAEGSPELQILSAESFRKFTNINADTPKFYEYLQPLVVHFARMCSAQEPNVDSTKSLRLAGLAGIQGLIIKTKDSVIQSVWNMQYTSLIIPSLLNNLSSIPDQFDPSVKLKPLGDEILPHLNEFLNRNRESSQINVNSDHLAALINPFSCSNMLVALYNLRELIQGATITNVPSVIMPIFSYWYDNDLWSDFQPSVRMIELISHSLKPQLEHMSIRLLFDEIRTHRSSPTVFNIIKILPHFSTRYSGARAGHIYYEILALLVVFLKESCTSKSDQTLTDTLIVTIESLVDKLPNFQKTEIYQAILNQIPHPRVTSLMDRKRTPSIVTLSEEQVEQSRILMNCLEKISMLYRPSSISAVFNLVFIEQLSECVGFSIPDVQLNVIKTLVNLVDQHKNYDLVNSYITSDQFDGICPPENDLRDISVKKLTKVTEILCSCVIKDLAFLELIKELTCFLCILCMEINIPYFHHSVCLTLMGIQVGTDKEEACDNYQSMLYTLMSFISVISKNTKLMDYCQNVKDARCSVAPMFWMPSSLVKYTKVLTDRGIPNIYFDIKQLEKAFHTKTGESLDSSDHTSTIVSSLEPSQMEQEVSAGSLESESNDQGTTRTSGIMSSARHNAGDIWNIGFMRRDRSAANSVSTEDIQKRIVEKVKDVSMPPKLGERPSDHEYFT